MRRSLARTRSLRRVDKSAGVDDVRRPVELPYAGRQIDGRRDCHDAGDQARGRLAEFARQLQHHVAAQREADQEDGRHVRQLANHGEQVGRLAGVIERPSGQMLGAAAASHVEAMHGASGFERGLRQAARVTGGAGSFQSMHQNQLRNRIALRRLGMDQDLDAGLGVVEFRVTGKRSSSRCRCQ